MSKRKLVVELCITCAAYVCGKCSYLASGRCGLFKLDLGAVDESFLRFYRCQPCLNAEQPASAPLSLVLSVPKARR